ncbi:hypothetical protein G3I13_03865 [Streptomyces sp. SID6673]|nr:hypothetical protein [Streptomyces sp. SID11726]NEB23462.1 hypothetical protein [Streptomyces sp. SID6673]
MRDPNSAIPEDATPALWRRYDEWRAGRHLRFNEKHAGALNSWRTRRGARQLVLLQVSALVVALVGAVTSFATMWFVIPFVVGVIGSLLVQYALRIVTGSIAGTPVPALDEIQLAQRNSARSVGFFVLYTLMFIPYAILIVLGTHDSVNGQSVYGTGILLITLVAIAVALPTMLTAWWMNDPDPEDLVTSETERSHR